MATSDDTEDSTDLKRESAKLLEQNAEMADLLRLLQPVESSWKALGRYLVRDDQQCKLNTIESDCFHNNASKKALDEVLNKWLECTVGKQRNWQTLCDAATKYGDDSLEKYVEVNKLKKNEEPTMRLLQRWSKESPLRTSWYIFAVDLVGKAKTEIIRATYFGGGDHSCLQRMLVTWYDSSTDHRWKVIVDALKEMDESRVIESIENHCRKKK